MKYAQEQPIPPQAQGVNTQQTTPQRAPQINTQTIASDLSIAVSESGSGIITAIRTIQIPPELLSFSFSPSSLWVAPSATNTPTSMLPKSPPIPTVSNPEVAIPTKPSSFIPGEMIIGENNTIPQQFITPTIQALQPTAVPKPTNKPAPTATPIPPKITIGLVRPQKTLDQVLDFVNKEACVPKNLFLAISQIENGLKFKNLEESKFTLYNTYNWWNKSEVTEWDIYFAQAYNSFGGVVPDDSKFAGKIVAVGIDPYDMKIMGPVPISEQEYNAYKDRINKILGQTTTDRRIILDSHLILGLHLKNISTYRGSDCNNWELKYITKAACKYLGKCTYDVLGNKGNYCIRACNNYNQYAGTNYNCDSIPSLISDDGKCTLN